MTAEPMVVNLDDYCCSVCVMDLLKEWSLETMKVLLMGVYLGCY